VNLKEGPDTLETRWVVIAMIPEGLVLEEAKVVDTKKDSKARSPLSWR
jgi:hypothetical protein